MLAAIALFVLAPTPGALPTQTDVDWARTARIHQCHGPEGMVHCRRFRDLNCGFVDGDRQLARCTYREWAQAEPWPLKSITLRRGTEDWQWVAGDPPHCSIMIISDE